MNGLAITIIVGQLPKLCGFSTDADGFVDEVRAFFDGLRRAQRDRARCSAWPRWPSCSCCPASPARSRPSSSPSSGRRSVTAVFDLGHRRPSGALPQGLPRPALPWTDVGDVGPMLVAAIGITLGVAHRHDRHVDELRRPPGRRGRPEPGDDRHRDGEHGGRVLPGLRRVDQRLAHGGRRAVRRQEPAHRAGRRRSSSRCCCCSSARCSPTSRRPRSPRS